MATDAPQPQARKRSQPAKKAAPATKQTTRASKQTTRAAKQTAQSAKQTARSADATARQARQTSAQAERTVRSLVSDGAYAALGVGDTAVGALKHLPVEVGRIRTEAPKTVEARVREAEQRVRTLWNETPEELQGRLEAVRRNAEQEFDGYARRGRAVAQSVQRNTATTRAVQQAKIARSQVKAAVTSVRKALGASVDAVETAAERVGDERRAG